MSRSFIAVALACSLSSAGCQEIFGGGGEGDGDSQESSTVESKARCCKFTLNKDEGPGVISRAASYMNHVRAVQRARIEQHKLSREIAKSRFAFEKEEWTR